MWSQYQLMSDYLAAGIQSRAPRWYAYLRSIAKHIIEIGTAWQLGKSDIGDLVTQARRPAVTLRFPCAPMPRCSCLAMVLCRISDCHRRSGCRGGGAEQRRYRATRSCTAAGRAKDFHMNQKGFHGASL